MKKKLFSIVSCMIIVSVVLTGCSFASTKLTGRWELIDGSGFNYIEFFSNGTYKSSHSNYEGGYSVDGNRLLLEGDLMDDVVRTFKVSGSTLKFYYDDGDVQGTYEKIK